MGHYILPHICYQFCYIARLCRKLEEAREQLKRLQGAIASYQDVSPYRTAVMLCMIVILKLDDVRGYWSR